MAKIYNNSIPQKAVKELKIEQSVDKVPVETSDKILLNYALNKNTSDIVRQVNVSTTGSNTIYTTDSRGDFYISDIIVSYQADATADVTNIRVEATIEGAVRRLVTLQKLNTTADSKAISVNLSKPIKIDKNTNVALVSAFTVGALALSATIYGYYA